MITNNFAEFMKDGSYLHDYEVRIQLKRDLLRAVREIIDQLPDSQQTFFRDMFLFKRSQAKIARMYNVKPQAITNRLYKLKRTVQKKLEANYGITREVVIAIMSLDNEIII